MEEPNRPEPQSIHLDRNATAVTVLAMTNEARDFFDPNRVSELDSAVGDFLKKARDCNVSIVFTSQPHSKGSPAAEVRPTLKCRDAEPVIYPDGYDKFVGGELQELLQNKGVKHLVLLGSGTNIAILYTATTATRSHRYNVVVQLDGLIARTPYQHEYGIHHLSVLPGGANELIRFSTLSQINFL